MTDKQMDSQTTYHAVLYGQHVSLCGVSVKQRAVESKALRRLVEDHRLQLLVITDQHNLQRSTRHDRHKTLGLFTHSTLVYDHLKHSHTRPASYAVQ